MYTLGVDLGTTYTAAATWRDDLGEVISLSSRADTIPSVVLLREDGSFLIGDAANRRGLTEPDRVAREFKRRFGDTTPILLGGAPHAADALTTQLLRSVTDQVTASQGGPPAALCLSHPANWGPYKTDLLRQAVQQAGVDLPVTYTTEPEAAAAFYAHQERVEPGSLIAVYDLGGGTFDATVLRRTGTGFEILGRPEGIERLGGIDFDAAVFSHVRQSLGSTLEELDEDDPAAIAAVARLRQECTAAKEALSSDTDATIPVLLPTGSTEVRLTRAELEAMVRPALHSTIEAMRRALRSAEVTPEQLHSVLLVGGGSRMPIVSQLLGAELGRPVAVDTHPKHAVALGTAKLAADSLAPAAATSPIPADEPPAAPATTPDPTATVTATSPVVPATPAPPPDLPYAPPSPALVGRAAVPPFPAESGPPEPDPDEPPRRRWPLLAAAAVMVAILGTAGVAMAIMNNPGPPPPGQTTGPTSASPTSSPTPSASATSDPSPTEDGTDHHPTPTWSPSPSPTPTASPTPTVSPTPTADPTVTVENVIGLGWQDAKAVLEAQGLTARAFCPLAAPAQPVTTQDPAAGTGVAAGSEVRIDCD